MSQKGVLSGLFLTFRNLGFCTTKCLLEDSQASEFQRHEILSLNGRTTGKCRTGRVKPKAKARTPRKQEKAKESGVPWLISDVCRWHEC